MLRAMVTAPEPSLIVIFGGTGDLARRKLLPAVARLAHGTHLPAGTQILGVAREQMDDAAF
jgi:glucose-6-phosphate 1-dehydrogenase